MSSEWSESFWLAIETFGTAVLMILTINIQSQSQQLCDILQQQQYTQTVLQETRTWLPYEDGDKRYYAADVISLILRYKSGTERTPKDIWIWFNGSHTYSDGATENISSGITFTEYCKGTNIHIKDNGVLQNIDSSSYGSYFTADTAAGGSKVKDDCNYFSQSFLSVILDAEHLYRVVLHRDGTGTVTDILIVPEAP